MSMSKKKFIALRRKLGLTQKQFGALLKFSTPQQRVSEIENGRRNVSAHVEALCEFIEKDHDQKQQQAQVMDTPSFT